MTCLAQIYRRRRVVSGSAPMLAAAIALAFATPIVAHEPPRSPAAQPGRQAQPQFTSAEVTADRRIVFRVFAPNAQTVRLAAGDIPGVTAATAAMTKADTGVWEITVGPVVAGAYRYNFNIDGVATVDPRSSSTSESNTNVWSVVVVPGNDLFDSRDVPHGAVAAVTYWSTTLGAFRRMHVYTPPGYEKGGGERPVFYLLHGAGDNDDAWSSVGRAGFVLDNLIAAGKATPMIVVMPAGHQPRAAGRVVGAAATEGFVDEFVNDVMPYVESHYRVRTGRADTAIAGLSMGGQQTLAVAIPRLGRFGYIGVFSSGLIAQFPDLRRSRGAAPAAGRAPQTPAQPTAAEWEQANAATLDDASLKAGLRLLWFGTGKDDFLLTTTRATVDLLTKHGFTPVFKESSGGHTWINWRDYLAEFAPQLFQQN